MKQIKYLFQFIIIMMLFFLFKILGYKNASNFGSFIGKLFGKLIRSDKIIKNYENHMIYIDKDKYDFNIFVSKDFIMRWPISDINKIITSDLDVIRKYDPEIIIVGTGLDPILPKTEIITQLHANNIGVEFMSTDAACKTFNVLLQEDRNVIAGLVV